MKHLFSCHLLSSGSLNVLPQKTSADWKGPSMLERIIRVIWSQLFINVNHMCKILLQWQLDQYLRKHHHRLGKLAHKWSSTRTKEHDLFHSLRSHLSSHVNMWTNPCKPMSFQDRNSMGLNPVLGFGGFINIWELPETVVYILLCSTWAKLTNPLGCVSLGKIRSFQFK